MYKATHQKQSQNESKVKKTSTVTAAILGAGLLASVLASQVFADTSKPVTVKATTVVSAAPVKEPAPAAAQPQPAAKTQDEINQEALLVIHGDLGNGAERVQRLTEANFDAQAVQNQVNKIYQEKGYSGAYAAANQASQATKTTAAPAAPAPAPSVVPGNDVVAYAANAMAANTGVSPDKWVSVIMMESGGNPNACNSSSGAYGLFQLLGHGEYSGMSIDEQIAMATRVYQSQGPSAWVVW
jgi:hypothetical protein